MNKTPYVHNYTDELEAMPLLSRGSNAAVFHTIGLLMPSMENGVPESEIAKYTGLHVSTIRTTLANLQTSGLIIQANGNYTAAKYIYFRKPIIQASEPVKKVFSRDDDDFNQSSKIKNQSNPSALVPEKNDFGLAYNALETLLILGGSGLSPIERESFKDLWAEFPDPELHRRARDIMQKKADRPNYRYYEKVVRTGAIETLPKQAEVLEVLL